MIQENLVKIKSQLPSHITLVAVSKTKPNSAVMAAYEAGQRDFGENYVQELVDKAAALPKDIHWHFIGHLQSNKVKYIAPFVYLIHGVDSFKLLKEIDKQAQKNNRIIPCLLQIHIAEEETKFGFNELELMEMLNSDEFKLLKHIQINGLMGMASFSDSSSQISNEFKTIQKLFHSIQSKSIFEEFKTLSIGMSGDYKLAIKNGSTLVRIGSAIFGSRFTL
jgi:PLP dependent protein